jgi:hypothetical protein
MGNLALLCGVILAVIGTPRSQSPGSPRRVRRWAQIVFVVALSGCSRKLEEPKSATSGPDSLRARPLVLPRIDRGQPCPVTTEVTTPSVELGTMLGSGLARPVRPGSHLEIAAPANFGSDTWGGNKVLWALSVRAGGVALIRGHQLDGDAEVRFDDGATPSLEKVLVAPTGKPLDGGWHAFPGSTRLSKPGCYGYQIDTEAETTTVVFVAD